MLLRAGTTTAGSEPALRGEGARQREPALTADANLAPAIRRMLHAVIERWREVLVKLRRCERAAHRAPHMCMPAIATSGALFACRAAMTLWVTTSSARSSRAISGSQSAAGGRARARACLMPDPPCALRRCEYVSHLATPESFNPNDRNVYEDWLLKLGLRGGPPPLAWTCMPSPTAVSGCRQMVKLCCGSRRGRARAAG
jgi:hypothetical protein